VHQSIARGAAARPIRVLVVDDSVVIRRLVTDVLSADPDIEVVGTAVNGRMAQAKIAQLQPDLVTMDIEMPEMDGISAVKALRVTHPRLPVIMFSTLTAPGASAALEALAAGATDYVTKPANVGSVSESMASVRDQLVPRVRALCGRGAGPSVAARPGAAPGVPGASASVAARPAVAHVAAPPAPRTAPSGTPRVLAIGCSTGGPQALTSVLQALPATFPLPIVVVQHMPPVFTQQFAMRLDRTCALSVHESAGGEVLRPGHVFIAPGNFHLVLNPRGNDIVTQLHQGPQVSFCRPSVDVLFDSVAGVYRGDVLSVVLTGMGSDGRDGADKIRRAGGTVIVQDEQTSVVWGMPGAIAAAGLADQILPLPEIADALQRATSRGTAPLARR